ncbi:MAG: hypothetical protein R3C08_07770 [Hyphomonas sp.]
MSQVTRRMRQVHNVLALVVGVQVLLWIVSGLFFTLFPIETIRGEPLRAAVEETLVPPEGGWLAPSEIAARAARVTLKPWLGRAVYVVEAEGITRMLDASTGEALSPLDEAAARAVAEHGWAGQGTLQSASLIAKAPSESGRPGQPMWRVEFDGADKATLWITPDTGEVRAVRTGLWRTYDLLWGLHIMDWSARETFTTWWIKATAFGALAMTLAGIWLLVGRVKGGRLLR